MSLNAMISQISENDDYERVALYLRVASSLRSRVSQGEWTTGANLPKLEDLCTEYGVSRNTIRQAIEVLRSVGVLQSSRGKGITISSAVRESADAGAIRNIISNPLKYASDLIIKVVQRERVKTLPAEIAAHWPLCSSYVLLKKLHYFRNIPYEWIEVYVSAEAYDRFPAGADERFLLSRLVSEYCGEPFASWHQEITVGHPDLETSRLLNYSMTRPIARIRRQRLDRQGRLLMGGDFVYRGDMFVLSIEGGGDTVPFSHVDFGQKATLRNLQKSKPRKKGA